MNSSITQKVSFLFGSGISISAGMPCVKQITERVRSGTDVTRNHNELYNFDPPLYPHADILDGYVPRVVEYLKSLSDEIKQYYSWDHEREVNYEDLYYVAAQIYDREWGQYDNPVAQAFVDKIRRDIKPLFVVQQNEIRREWTLSDIAREATNYIYDIVWAVLDKEPSKLDYLRCVGEAFHDPEISSLDLFTVNHDTVIERYLEGCEIKYTDGFEPPVNGVRYWSPGVLERPCHNVRLLKLHGSVKWFPYELHRVGIPDNWRHRPDKNPSGQFRQLPVVRPMLLVGTYNKMRQYTSGIYADLYFELRRTLRETKRLIVCGYSFGDQGINRQIIEWANSADQKRKVMVVIHQQPERLKKKAGPDIFSNWDCGSQSKRLVFVQKRIEDTSWNDIKEAILDATH